MMNLKFGYNSTVAKPSEPCQYSQQCSGFETGAFCINHVCRCIYGMVETKDGHCCKLFPKSDNIRVAKNILH